jgi:hypothetical protein
VGVVAPWSAAYKVNIHTEYPDASTGSNSHKYAPYSLHRAWTVPRIDSILRQPRPSHTPTPRLCGPELPTTLQVEATHIHKGQLS